MNDVINNSGKQGSWLVKETVIRELWSEHTLKSEIICSECEKSLGMMR